LPAFAISFVFVGIWSRNEPEDTLAHQFVHRESMRLRQSGYNSAQSVEALYLNGLLWDDAPVIFGINATKTNVVIAETRGAGNKFVITAIRSIPFQVRSGEDLANLLPTLSALMDRKGKGADSVIALLKCSSGRFGSCLEAIKGEAMVELAAYQLGLRVIKVAPQSLKKSLGCAADQKWRDRAAELFNPDGKRLNWSKGAAGAVAAAFKVAEL
jgi:hypothetical protein